MADLDEILGNSEDEGDSMTAAEVLQKLEELWVTEKMSPTLEMHKTEIVECMLDQLQQMTKNIKRCKTTDLRLPIHKMEIDRIRYIISSYLRTRLDKIEKFTHYLLETDGKVQDKDLELLSPEEKKYATEFAACLEAHFGTLALQHVPENLRSFDVTKMVVRPNLESYIFFKVKEDTPNLLVEDSSVEGRDEEVDLEVGGQHLMRYKSVKHLLHSGAINLI